MQKTLDAGPEVAGRKQSARSSQTLTRALMAVVALVVGAGSVVPYFFSHYDEYDGRRYYRLIKSHDITNHYFAMEQFEKTLRAGALYPRWYMDANHGYGIATPNYYPPGFYYCAALVNAVFNNWHTTLLVIMALAFAGSGLALYFTARTFFARAPSAIAALVYMLLPYHQLELYWRGAFAEIIGFILIPLALRFAYKVGSEGRWRDGAGLGLIYGLHLLTHLPVGLMFTYGLAFYAVVWAIKERDLKIVLRIGAGMALGLMISAVYWLPAALEMKYAFENQTLIYPYHTAYISPLPTTDPFFSIIEKTLKLNALLLLTVIAALRFGRSAKNESNDSSDTAQPVFEIETRAQLQVWLWVVMCGATLFMTTAFSYDISILLPKIEITVPPFRWLAISSVFTSLLVAACADRLMSPHGFKRRSLLAWRVATCAIVIFNLAFCFKAVINKALENPDFYPVEDYVEQGLTPRDATAPDKLPDTPLIAVTAPGSFSEVVRWEPQLREVRVNATAASKVRLKTYNFPGWTARIDGQSAAISSDEDGAQLIEVPPGLRTIEVKFENTLPRALGGAVTFAGFLAVLGLKVLDTVKRRRRLHARDI